MDVEQTTIEAAGERSDTVDLARKSFIQTEDHEGQEYEDTSSPLRNKSYINCP